jgi:two-component system, OmpR family, phosphate regulon sensor histidine kinase PhoR
VLRGAGAGRTWQVAAAPLVGWPAEQDTGALHERRAGAAPPAPVLMTFRDVTEVTRMLAVRTDFVANASHELRTPIAAIRMALETLETEGDEGGELRARLLSIIASQVARLEELARDLLDLSRLESEAEVRTEPLALADVAASLRTAFEGVLRERRLTLEFEISEGAAVLRTDRRLLELIVSNLIDNAAKFAFEGTPVRVVADRGPAGVRVRVIDRGQGIPLADQPRIFERFYQVDPARAGGGDRSAPARRGSGLGLAIVKHAVRRLGGSVNVSSVWQQGTTMTVELPA